MCAYKQNYKEKMKKLFALSVITTTLAGCAIPSQQPTYIQIKSKFDIEDTKERITDGDGAFPGTAFLRQQGGGVVTCAGNDVGLIPATDYAAERLKALYGRAPSLGETRFMDIKAVPNLQFSPDEPQYPILIKTVSCDAQGNFEFTNVKDGYYFISTSVLWAIGSRQGGYLVTKVKIRDGKSPRVIISPK